MSGVSQEKAFAPWRFDVADPKAVQDSIGVLRGFCRDLEDRIDSEDLLFDLQGVTRALATVVTARGHLVETASFIKGDAALDVPRYSYQWRFQEANPSKSQDSTLRVQPERQGEAVMVYFGRNQHDNGVNVEAIIPTDRQIDSLLAAPSPVFWQNSKIWASHKVDPDATQVFQPFCHPGMSRQKELEEYSGVDLDPDFLMRSNVHARHYRQIVRSLINRFIAQANFEPDSFEERFANLDSLDSQSN